MNNIINNTIKNLIEKKNINEKILTVNNNSYKKKYIKYKIKYLQLKKSKI